MTELRTTTPLSYSLQLLQAMGSAIRNINPKIGIRSEISRRAVEILVTFPDSNALEQFLDALAGKGIRFESAALRLVKV